MPYVNGKWVPDEYQSAGDGSGTGGAYVKNGGDGKLVANDGKQYDTIHYNNGSWEDAPKTKPTNGFLDTTAYGAKKAANWSGGALKTAANYLGYNDANAPDRRYQNKDAYYNPSSAGLQDEAAMRRAYIDGREGPHVGYTGLDAAALANGVKLGAAAQYGGPDLSADLEGRGYQSDLARALALQAQGKGPSMAGMQLQQGMEAALAGQLAAQSSIRGRANIGMGLRGSMQNMAQMQQAAAMEAAKMKVQEQFNAQQNLAGLSSSMRSGDMSAAGLKQAGSLANMSALNQFGLQQGSMDLQAQLANQGALNQFSLQQGQMNQAVNLANAQNELAKMGLDDNAINALLGKQFDMSEADRKAAMQYEQDTVAAHQKYEDMAAAGKKDMYGRRGGLISGIGAAFAAFSDENEKKNVASGDAEVQNFMQQYSAGTPPPIPPPTPAPVPVAPTPTASPVYAPANPSAQYIPPQQQQNMQGLYDGDDDLQAAIEAEARKKKEEEEQKKKEEEEKNKKSAGMAAIGGFLQGVGSSDENRKKNISGGDSRVEDFMRGVNAHSYEYKNPNAVGAGHGRFVSPMAQELEKTDLGKSMVMDTPQGKMVDYGKGFGVMLAGTANHEKRIMELEAALASALQKGKK